MNIKTYEVRAQLQLGGFLVALDEIDIFERKNDVSVNVLAIGGGKEKLYILIKSKFDSQKTARPF